MAYNDEYYDSRYSDRRETSWNGGRGSRGARSNGSNARSGYRGRRDDDRGRKHSGCQFGVSKETGKEWMNGWNYSRQNGMVKFVASPSPKVNGGPTTDAWCAKITVGKQAPYLVTCFMTHNTKRLTFPDLGMVANASAPNGGYWGKFTQSKRR